MASEELVMDGRWQKASVFTSECQLVEITLLTWDATAKLQRWSRDFFLLAFALVNPYQQIWLSIGSGSLGSSLCFFFLGKSESTKKGKQVKSKFVKESGWSGKYQRRLANAKSAIHTFQHTIFHRFSGREREHFFKV